MSKRQVTCVSFSGIDGAGKSTQIDELAASLSREGLRVRVYRFWDDIARLTRVREGAGHRVFKGDKGIGRPEAPIHRRDKNVRGFPMACVRLFLYMADAISLRRVTESALRGDADFVIFDRHIYDELANLDLANGAMRAYARLVMKIVPRPDVSFVLDADPKVAHARKPEYPLEFVRMNRQAYLELNRLIGGLTIVPPGSIEDARAEVLRCTLAAMRTRTGSGGSEKPVAARASHARIP
jgi:thymidylate kinase